MSPINGNFPPGLRYEIDPLGDDPFMYLVGSSLSESISYFTKKKNRINRP